MERWIEISDQGGLVQANKEFYSFALKIEEEGHCFMKAGLLRKNQKEDMRKIFKINQKIVPKVSFPENRQLSDKLFAKLIE